METDNKSPREQFTAWMAEVDRDGVDTLLEDLEADGFFTAPASDKGPLACPGGLLQHSVNVCRAALMLWERIGTLDPALHREVKRDNVIVAALLHDVAQITATVPTIKRHRTATGQSESVQAFAASFATMPVGRGTKGIIWLLDGGFALDDEEIMAIRWAQGSGALNMSSDEDVRSFDAARTLTPLATLLQNAVNLATNVLDGSQPA